jgi:hypothetical protein
MFEQTSRLAEKLAASVSRRGFLGSLGGWAAAAAMGVAGLLTGAGTGRAAPPELRQACCVYSNSAGTCGILGVSGESCRKNPCPSSLNGCPLSYCFERNGGICTAW